jgi:dTDP-4-dehydrorhamnose reductase
MAAQTPTILLTGANGQVGWEVQRRAQHAKIKLQAFGSSELNITDASAVSAAVKELQPGAVINAAAYTAVDKAEAERELAFAVNRDGATNLADACQQMNIPLLHISTDYVYDGNKPEPYTEQDPPHPMGVYGESKWEGDQAVANRLEQHLILRVSWVFGSHGHNFVKTMLRLGKERTELRVVADQHGCPTPAADIADTLVLLAQRVTSGQPTTWGTYHYAGQPPTTWHGFALSILDQATSLGLIDHPVQVHPITTAEYPTPAKRPANSVLNCEKLTNTFGISPHPWKDGLRTMLEEIRNGGS